ncbi:hypothetical protein DYU11_09300 [Fibrisoma montanum]|uniref:Uncharacterized protein n=1 Tax=Fibrisoma montanum TaxID=2305895 RepID=A0A418MFA6_9BACT|nr:hypothetical protein [Fibrisoma montanum]RIV25482.1 hypothetical protein DYU11_09300 [Fibrisoma montanum]
MSTSFTKHLCAALLGVAVFSSCSRPVAYFQPSQREQFRTPTTETVAVTPASPQESVAAPVETAPATVAVTETAAPAAQVAQARVALDQVEAYVRNDNQLATNKKLEKRMSRVKNLMNTVSQKEATTLNTTTSAKKLNLFERAMVKRIDKQIKNKMAPNKTKKTMATTLLKAGIIIGIIGLILLLVGNGVGATIGLIALIAGLVLIILDLVNT